MRKQWLGWVLLAGVCAPQMRADDASKRAKVEQLFTLMHLNQSVEQLISGVQRQADAMMSNLPGGDTMTAEQRRLVTEYRGKVNGIVTQGLAWKTMEPQLAALYMNAYSEQDLDGILAFYKTPAGQAMLAKSPELSHESLQVTQEKAGTMRPQLQATMEEFAKKYQAAAPAKPASPAGGATGAKPSGSPK